MVRKVLFAWDQDKENEMKRFNVIHKLLSGDVQSDFDSLSQMEGHKSVYPEMYEPNCTTILTDNEALKIKTEIMSIEDQIDALCKKAYREIKIYNRKNFMSAQVQAVVNHPKFIVLYCLLDGGNPSLSLAVFNEIGFNGYTLEVLSSVNQFLTQAIALSSQE